MGRAVAAREPQDADSGAEALLAMWFGCHDGLDERDLSDHFTTQDTAKPNRDATDRQRGLVIRCWHPFQSVP